MICFQIVHPKRIQYSLSNKIKAPTSYWMLYKKEQNLKTNRSQNKNLLIINQLKSKNPH